MLQTTLKLKFTRSLKCMNESKIYDRLALSYRTHKLLAFSSNSADKVLNESEVTHIPILYDTLD